MTKILLVEDDKSLREIYGVRLLAEGYDIVSAGDGEDALAMAIKEKPTLIISDVMMPKISGFDMLDILRSTTETRDIKVIMMTALSSDDQRTRGEQLGADRYLVKSQVGIEDVVRTVHEVLEDTPGANTAVATPAPAAPAEPATDTTPPASTTDTPSVDTASPATPTSDNTPVADDPQPLATTAAPGNDGAGPLPPQPAQAEDTLPQPTAPFTSPRPANLGERLIQPLSPEGDTPSVDTASPVAQDAAPTFETPIEPQADTANAFPTADTGFDATPAVDAAPSIEPVEPATAVPSPEGVDPFTAPADDQQTNTPQTPPPSV